MPKVPEAEASQEPQEREGPLHILLAEDNRMNQRVATLMIEKLGHYVEIAETGKEAIERAREGNYDLILMDWMMPEMDGLEATRALRALGGALAQVPVIALTANATEEQRQTCIDAGMNDFLAKPIQFQVLMDKIVYWGQGKRPAAL